MQLGSSHIADFDKIHHDIRFLITCLREVLDDLGESDLARALPWQADDSTAPHIDSIRRTQAYSIAFQLLNMVEENAIVQYRRDLERRHESRQFSGLWSQTIFQLKEQGLSEDQVAAALSRVRVEPVLTAHPTEAKRFTVLEQHRALYLMLVQLENPVLTPLERDTIRNSIKASLEKLWRTGEIYLEKPDVASEVRNVLYYLRNRFPDVLNILDERLFQFWEDAGFDVDHIKRLDNLPRLSFGTWVGGDRDGHPLVTAATTETTLHNLRATALDLLRERLIALAQGLSLTKRIQTAPPTMVAHIESLAESLGEAGQHALDRNPQEPWRQFINLMVVQLPSAESDGDSTPVYADASALIVDLQHLYDGLVAIGAGRLADSDVMPLLRIVQTFGFHMATLDIRQNSRFHDLALAQLLHAAGLPGEDFPDWDEERRLEFLNAELKSVRPFTLPDMPLGPEAQAVVDSYRVIARHIKTFGTAGLGALIVSMTRSLSDLLVVYLLAREAGVVINTDAGLVCRLPVVPLFETIDDLERSPDILDAFLSHPVTKASLAYHQHINDADEQLQQVMVGYSDSNKDGGIFASLWNLQIGQRELTRVAAQHGVRVRFFHGRGGSISRGAGPTHRFIRALPPASLGGDLRVTEQGEVIARKYANRLTAMHNLELMLAGVLHATGTQEMAAEPSHALEPIMHDLVKRSNHAYRQLLENDNFIHFYRKATPIDVIESSRIGSRPARRTGQHTLADLRAIPWVFSWSQARFFLSGWYGAGTALNNLKSEAPADFERLRQQVFEWPPLHTMISSVASNIMTADVDLMREYAALVDDESVREPLLSDILAEYERTNVILEQIYGGPLAQRRPNVQQVIAPRQPPLRELHDQQLDLLRRWRAMAAGEADNEDLLLQLLSTVNAIAHGLGTTG